MTISKDLDLIGKIADRGQAMAVKFDRHDMAHDRTGIVMDLLHVHERLPMYLEEFLEADDASFSHDFFGIYNNFNRDTLKLDNGWTPRHSIPIGGRPRREP